MPRPDSDPYTVSETPSPREPRAPRSVTTDARRFLTYELAERITFGGNGEAFRARDTRLDRSVALKLLPVDAGTDRAFVDRFRRELPLVATLDEPHLVPIHDFGFKGGRLFLVTRYVEGEDLSSIIEREGPLAPPRALAVVEQAAEALDALHAAGLVHGDVRPANLRLTPHGFVYLLDTGLAPVLGVTPTSLTVADETAPALACVAPERLTGRPVDARSDVYSLACVLFECLTGTRPYAVQDLPSLLYAQLSSDALGVLPDDVPPALLEVIRGGMARKPEDRPPTASGFAAAARSALGAIPPSGEDRPDASPASAPASAAASGRTATSQLPRLAGRGMRLAAAVLLGLLLLLAVLAAVLWSGRGDPDGRVVPSDAGAGSSIPSPEGSGAAGSAEHHQAEEAEEAEEAEDAEPVEPAASLAEPRVARSVEVGQAPHEVAMAPDGASAYIADPEAGAVFVWDTAEQEQTASIPIPQGPPQMVSVSPDGTRLHVSVFDEDYSTNAVVTVDTGSRRVLHSVPVGRGPYAAEPTPDGDLLYVPLFDEPYIDVIDTSTGSVVDRVDAAANPHWMAFPEDGRTAYTANHFSDVVAVLDLRRNTTVREIAVGDGPHSVELSPDGTRLAVANYIDGTVSVIDTASHQVVRTVTDVGAGPQDVTFAPDGRHLYTANVDDGSVGVIDTGTYEVTARIPTGTSPTSVEVAPDGTTALVSNFDEGTVTVLETSGS